MPSFHFLVENVREDAHLGIENLRYSRRDGASPRQRVRRPRPVGETVIIDGRELPFRPVAVTLGKTVNNGWGGFDAVGPGPCWLVWSTPWKCLAERSGLVRLNRPATSPSQCAAYC